MTAIYIPQNGCTLTLQDDWQVRVTWAKRNLRMLAKFKLTGMQEVTRRSYAKWDVAEGKYVAQEYVQRKTVPNKLFMDYEGNYTPVELTFPVGTEFTLSRYNYSNFDGIRSVDMKCLSSPMKGIKGLCLQLELMDLNGMPAAITAWLDEELDEDQ